MTWTDLAPYAKLAGGLVGLYGSVAVLLLWAWRAEMMPPKRSAFGTRRRANG